MNAALAVRAVLVAALAAAVTTEAHAVEAHDAHFHLTNYVQRGPSAKAMLAIMGDKVGRAVLFGLPVQQKWDYGVSGDVAPTYYLHSDAELYYYSFLDAAIAQEYLRLTPAERARFDPMITGFNPTDMYAVEHIKRVLAYFPGVFTGIGEFSIDKEFVSAKIAGGTASVRSRAVQEIFSFAAEAGLLVLLHSDVSTIISPLGERPSHLDDLKALFRANPGATIIWAHTGLGRMVKPTKDHVKLMRELLSDEGLVHVSLDLSWDVVAAYVVAGEEALAEWSSLVSDYPDRFLFGSDAVAPKDQASFLKTLGDYGPLWARLTPAVAAKVKKGNYERLFDGARAKVRAWEQKQVTLAGRK